jgi:hypothetical protein
MNTYEGSGGIDPRYRNFGPSWEVSSQLHVPATLLKAVMLIGHEVWRAQARAGCSVLCGHSGTVEEPLYNKLRGL